MKKLIFILVAFAATTLMSAQIVKVKVIKPIAPPPRPVVVVRPRPVTPTRPVVIVSPRPVVTPTRPVVIVRPRPAPVRTVVVHDDDDSEHRWENNGKHKGHYKKHYKKHHKDHDDKDHDDKD